MLYNGTMVVDYLHTI